MMRPPAVLKAALLLSLVALAGFADTTPREITLDQALAAARAHQPQLQQAHAVTEGANAQADAARAALRPQVGGTASYERTTENYAPRPGSVPSGTASSGGAASSWSTVPFYSVGVNATQLLWDFGATSSRWRASQAAAASQADSERANALQVTAAVRTAFFQARAARELVAVAVETLANQDRHLTQVEAFVEVGTQPEIALATARAARANARYQLILAQNGYATAKALLNQAMGVEQTTGYDVADETLSPVSGEDDDTDTLVAEAVSSRPETASMAEAVHAQELSVRASKADYWPSISAATGVTDAGSQVASLGWNWSASVNVTVPIFRGGQVGAQVRAARWSLEALKAQADALRQQIRLDVEQARLGVTAAKAALDSAHDALVNAQDQLHLAEGRYETGVGTVIELSDAQVALTSAAQQQVQARYNLASARTQLLRAMGRD